MDKYKREELEETLQIVSSIIGRCEKTQPKFAEGTSQHTLLKNRIKAMYISKSLINENIADTNENIADINENIADTNENIAGTNEDITAKYTKEELMEALRPVSSVISKCEKAQLKFAEGTPYHIRFENMIKAMYISKSLITDEISKRG
jgi:hypothetical protein